MRGILTNLALTAVVVTAVTFNAALAVINGHVTPLAPAAVIAAELLVVGAAQVLAALDADPRMLPWYLIGVVLIALFLGRSLLTGEIAPKYARDVLLIPTFIVLGMAADARTLDRTVLIVLALVLIVAAIEVFAPESYAALFKIQDYYIQTRGVQLEDFYSRDSDLFVSAVRPEGRLFAFLDMPRASSLFLEPVSLGNYCSIMTGYLCARCARLGWLATTLIAIALVALLLASDGRLATATSLLIVMVAMMARWLPQLSSYIYLPAAVVSAFVLVAVTGAQSGADDALGRIAHTVELLRQYELADWLGASDDYLREAMDSGIAYAIATQSIVGVVLLWTFLALFSSEDTLEQIRFKHAALLYVSLTMLVSYSLFTIKTAAVLWFIHGALQANAGSPATAPGIGELRHV